MNKLLSEVLRPTTFEEITIPDDIKKRLIRMSESGNVMNMLFYGKPGTGKTSMGKLFTESENFESLIINGSLETSVDDVRRKIVKGWSFFFYISKGSRPKSPHKFHKKDCTKWFEMSQRPARDGFYEVKKCDEEISPVLLKWNKDRFYCQKEDHEYDKDWNIKSTKTVDVEVPLTDISCWRGLKKQNLND